MLQELGSWLRSMRRRAVLLKHEMIVGLLTNVRKKTSLQQSFAVVTCIYLGSKSWAILKDRVLSCSVVYRKFMRSKNVRAFCHCVSSVTVVLWQKVNLTNNHLIFQNKIDVILCENNWRLIWHIIQHTALASSGWTTKNKGYGFYWPTLYILTVAEYEVVCDLSNGAVFNDLRITFFVTYGAL